MLTGNFNPNSSIPSARYFYQSSLHTPSNCVGIRLKLLLHKMRRKEKKVGRLGEWARAFCFTAQSDRYTFPRHHHSSNDSRQFWSNPHFSPFSSKIPPTISSHLLLFACRFEHGSPQDLDDLSQSQ